MTGKAAADVSALLDGLRANAAVPDGWGGLLNLSASAVRQLVLSDWNATPSDVAGHSLLWVAAAEVNGRQAVVEVSTTLPPPDIALSIADQALVIDFTIDSGTMRIGTVPTGSAAALRAGEGAADVDTTIPILPGNPLRLAGTVPLATAAAADGASFDIALDVGHGVLALTGGGAENFVSEAPVQGLADWLRGHDVSARIATVAIPAGADVDALSPASVAVRIGASVEGEPLLQLFTSSAPGLSAAPTTNPVPHPQGQDFSFLVHSETVMTMIAASYNAGTGVVKLVAMPPSVAEPHWFVQVHQPMVFTGAFGNSDGAVYHTDRSNLFMCFGGSTDQGLRLFTAIDPASTIRLELDLAAHYPVAIGGSGADQLVGLREGSQSVGGAGFYESIVRPQLEAFLTGDIRADMTRVTLAAVSNLLLRDLSLPGHSIDLELAALPGELLVAGRLITAE